MNYFIGIVPPTEIRDAIYEIQKQFGDNRLEPHITIRPPVRLVDEAKWLEAIERITGNFTAFNVHLTSTDYFGKGVLYIKAESKELHALHSELMGALEPYEQKKPKDFEPRDFHAHLTLGKLWCGFTKEGFIEMEKLAKEYLTEQSIKFQVDFLRIYNKPKSNERYNVLKDVLLKR